MKLYAFGDSWTEGVGSNIEEEYATTIPEEKTRIRNKYSWPTHLAKILKIDVQNYGVGAFSNNAIFNTISYQLKNEIITKDDFVVIMWSSSLRDQLPFFPNESNFHIWGKRYKTKQHLLRYIFDGIEGNNINYNRAEKNFREYYINNLYTDTYYDIVNQNYIMYLQFIFKEMGIRYMFCDAFDTMLSVDIDKSNLIDSNRYWGYRIKTFRDFLAELNRKDVWEDNELWYDKLSGKHPSKNGYELIANEMYNYILKNNLLENNYSVKSNII